jgi:hypothetical protein
MCQEFPQSTQTILYDEDERPELFAYFVQGGSGQVLDNAHGNVHVGVANGTPCTMHSLAWDDPDDERTVLETIAKSNPGKVLICQRPPITLLLTSSPNQEHNGLNISTLHRTQTSFAFQLA